MNHILWLHSVLPLQGLLRHLKPKLLPLVLKSLRSGLPLQSCLGPTSSSLTGSGCMGFFYANRVLVFKTLQLLSLFLDTPLPPC